MIFHSIFLFVFRSSNFPQRRFFPSFTFIYVRRSLYFFFFAYFFFAYFTFVFFSFACFSFACFSFAFFSFAFSFVCHIFVSLLLIYHLLISLLLSLLLISHFFYFFCLFLIFLFFCFCLLIICLLHDLFFIFLLVFVFYRFFLFLIPFLLLPPFVLTSFSPLVLFCLYHLYPCLSRFCFHISLSTFVSTSTSFIHQLVPPSSCFSTSISPSSVFFLLLISSLKVCTKSCSRVC